MRKAFVVTDCGLCLKNYFYIQIDEIRIKITGSFTFVQDDFVLKTLNLIPKRTEGLRS